MIEEHPDEIDGSHNFNDNEKNEEFLRVLDELEVKKRQCINEQQRVNELEEQLHVISKYIIRLLIVVLIPTQSPAYLYQYNWKKNFAFQEKIGQWHKMYRPVLYPRTMCILSEDRFYCFLSKILLFLIQICGLEALLLRGILMADTEIYWVGVISGNTLFLRNVNFVALAEGDDCNHTSSKNIFPKLRSNFTCQSVESITFFCYLSWSRIQLVRRLRYHHQSQHLIVFFSLPLVQDNNALQNRLADATTQEEIKSMHDELSILDEVR